jgi:hypothetical protein
MIAGRSSCYLLRQQQKEMARQRKTLQVRPSAPNPHTQRSLTDAADSCTVNAAGVVPLLPSTAGVPAATVTVGGCGKGAAGAGNNQWKGWHKRQLVGAQASMLTHNHTTHPISHCF